MSDSHAREGTSEANMLMGSCLCGGVRYRAEGPLSLVARCHCIWCRKQSGAEFATNGSVSVVRLRLGCLDTEFSQPVQVRVFTARKMAISDFADEIPSFETVPGATRSDSDSN